MLIRTSARDANGDLCEGPRRNGGALFPPKLVRLCAARRSGRLGRSSSKVLLLAEMASRGRQMAGLKYRGG